MSVRLRRWIPLTLLLSLAAGVWIGWTVLREVVEEWASQEHKVGAWSIRVFGGRLPSWRTAHADSVRVAGPGAAISVARVRIDLETRDGSEIHRFPLHVRVSLGRADVALLPTVSEPTTRPPSFPSTLRLPVSFGFGLDTLRVERQGAFGIQADGIRLGSRGPAGVEATWRDLRATGIPAWSSGAAGLDWSGDSLRGDLRLALASGCCARDSASLSAALGFGDLTAGRASLRARVESLAGWNELLPGVVHAPAVDDVRVEVDAVRSPGAFPAP